ncbi:MAG: hypothetical protein M3O15_04515 [Acidobacteriota bacterium]|nr:hypothetical protein [Acidobacteriota bacterium]
MIVMTALAALLLTVPVQAAAPKTYQVTGPVLEVTSDMIVVQKGKERWEVARDASTKVSGDLKVGSKVTIEYRMTAASVDVKGDAGAKAGKSGKGAKKGTGTGS